MNSLIIGFGVVGKNMAEIFPDAEIHDPAQGYDYLGVADVGFACVPTERLENGSADLSIVKSVVDEWAGKCKALVIKSTVPPGTTQWLGHDNLIMSPEYFGGTQHANAHNYDFVILGGERKYTKIVTELYKEHYAASLRIILTDSTTAELTKYMENSWLATKVTFCNEFYRLAQQYGVDYDELRECWLADPRVNPSHTFVYRDHPYWDSHCLNKDVPAIVTHSKNAPLLESVININEAHKRDI